MSKLTMHLSREEIDEALIEFVEDKVKATYANELTNFRVTFTYGTEQYNSGSVIGAEVEFESVKEETA